eukprot:2402134-Rhodomonas_salina.1
MRTIPSVRLSPGKGGPEPVGRTARSPAGGVAGPVRRQARVKSESCWAAAAQRACTKAELKPKRAPAA